MRPKQQLLIVTFLTIVSLSGQALASLGEGVDSIASDRKALSAQRNPVIAHGEYTIEVLASDSATVREYVTPSGVVFGIAWNGLAHPDLSRLLGSYAPEYDKAVKQKRRVPGRRSSRIKTDRLVVETWGHMRNLQGRAYDPSLIPAGVNVDDIK